MIASCVLVSTESVDGSSSAGGEMGMTAVHISDSAENSGGSSSVGDEMGVSSVLIWFS